MVSAPDSATGTLAWKARVLLLNYAEKQNRDLHHFPRKERGTAGRYDSNWSIGGLAPSALVMVITQKEVSPCRQGIHHPPTPYRRTFPARGTVAIRNGVGPICRGDEMVEGARVERTCMGYGPIELTTYSIPRLKTLPKIHPSGTSSSLKNLFCPNEL